MNVTENRKINKTIILGSGQSVLDIKQEEIKYINKCKTVIAVNKFMAFYKKTGLVPTHVYFHDLFGYEVFIYILKVCKENHLEGLTFITSPFYKIITYVEVMSLPLKLIQDLYIRFRAFVIIILKAGKNIGIHKFKLLRKMSFYKLPTNSKLYGIKVTKWDKGGKWANNFNQKIFHFRGSLTSVLNIASIIAPGDEIILVGNDFNGSEYFYEKELEKLNLKWKDFTYNIVKKEKKHFSFYPINGSKMTDKFPYINKQLNENGISLFCNNKDSLLVKEGSVKYKSLATD